MFAAFCFSADTSVPQDEGQHLQNVYPTAMHRGGQLYAFSKSMRMTEEYVKQGSKTRDKLIEAWSPYWDLSRPLLLEKSPPDIMKMRYLQEVFSGQRSKFVLMLRHPWGVARAMYRMNMYQHTSKKDCGAVFVRHWLKIYETAIEDIKYLDSVAAVQMEDMVDNSLFAVQGYVSELEDFLGLPHRIHVETTSPLQARMNRRRHRKPRRQGRVLAGYIGDKQHVKVTLNNSLHWTTTWEDVFDKQSPECQEMISRYEPAVNKFGYSLRNFSHVTEPEVLRHVLLKYRSFDAAESQAAAQTPNSDNGDT